ncbi:hypothetical protein, partial [Xanthomonas arboricola]|uniref:hypothetical protein n=1 Tax=Xanthomonas arboricola TaxID=56448 RepID=UPI0035E6193E
ASLRAFCLVPDIRRACSASIIGSHQPSAISHQPSAISHQPSASNQQTIDQSSDQRPSDQAINQATKRSTNRLTQPHAERLDRPTPHSTARVER